MPFSLVIREKNQRLEVVRGVRTVFLSEFYVLQAIPTQPVSGPLRTWAKICNSAARAPAPLLVALRAIMLAPRCAYPVVRANEKAFSVITLNSISVITLAQATERNPPPLILPVKPHPCARMQPPTPF